MAALAEAADSAERARLLAAALVLRAEHDTAFAQALAEWRRKAEPLVGPWTGSRRRAQRDIGGTQETVIMTRDIHGSINLGG